VGSGSAVSTLSGLWGGAPKEIEFGVTELTAGAWAVNDRK